MLLKDFQQAIRMLRKNPAFAATSIITIALGIGASTAIFSVTNAVLLRPLPYRNSERLVFLCSDMTKRNVKDFPFANADFFDLRQGMSGSLESVAAVATDRIVMPRNDGTPEQIRVANVTTNFFQLLGGKIATGRDFEESDGQAQTPPPQGVAQTGPPQLPTFAILSHEYWLRRYGADTSVLGHGMLGSKGGPQVVGVLAPGFELLFPPNSNMERLPDVWFAARIPYDGSARGRNQVTWRLIGRLKPGATLDQAQARAHVIAAQIRQDFPIKQTAGFEIRVEPMHKYIVEEARPAILALMGAVVFLLLIACANVANLLLVRLSLRERELAIRGALGATQGSLLRQMLVEMLVIAGAGAILGIGLASAGIQELLLIAPAGLPRLETIRIDPVVLSFALIASVVAAAVFGLTPALRAARPDLMHVLRSSGRTAALGGSGVLRDAVVVAEVALCFVLLIGSGLMIRSFVALQRIDPGFDPHHVLTFQLDGATPGTVPQQRAAFMQALQQRLRAVPGVQSVTAAFPFPLARGFSPIRWGKEDALADSTKFQAVDFQIVQPGYFETLRTPLIEGRTFNDHDNVPGRDGVIIDQFLAAKAFPNQSAIGKRLLIRIRTPEPEWVQVIGVVAHQRATSLAEPGREQIYFTDAFLGYGVTTSFGIRVAGNPAQYQDAIRAEVTRFNPGLVLTEVQPMDALVTRAQASTRFSLVLIGVFALIAVVLAGVGLYGVLATMVRQRTAEIGVRMAMGAAPGRVFQLIAMHGLRLSAVGIALGFVAALGLTGAMSSMLVDLKPTDPATYAAMAVVFLFVAVLGAWLPARRAAGLDPIVALREE